MPNSPQQQRATVLAVVLGATSLIAQQVASKAARDALYLTHFPVTSLPLMVMGAAAFAVIMAIGFTKAVSRTGPQWLVPRALLASAALFLVEWFVLVSFPRAASIAVFLHVAGLGSILVSGFWTLVNECFDPRSAKRHFGRIAAAATLGGLIGGLLAERVATLLGFAWVLPLLAVLHAVAGFVLLRVRPPTTVFLPTGDEALGTQSIRRTLRQVPYLRNLATLVLVGTAAAALLDYVFKVRVTESIESGPALMRFFTVFYAAVGLGTFLIQSIVGHLRLQNLGLAMRVATYPGAIAVGGALTWLVPFAGPAAFARALPAILYSSMFRSGYEALFSPVDPRDKRATKAFIDVGFERAGDALGAGIVRTVLFLPVAATSVLMGACVVIALVGLFVARRLQSGYVRELEQRLESGVARIDVDDIDDPMARSMIETIVPDLGASWEFKAAAHDEEASEHELDDEMRSRIDELRCGDAFRVLSALKQGPIVPALVRYVVPLLGWDAVSAHVARALSENAADVETSLVRSLLDRNMDAAVRRRIPGLLTRTTSERVIDGLLRGLLDSSFEIRFLCGRALARIHAQDSSVAFDRHRVFTIVLRETRVDRGVWERQRLLEELEEGADEPFVSEYLRQRSSRSLQHVFTVLSLALDKKPLQVAFQGLYTDDPILRGTALEYLESVLPEDIRESLWPFLEKEGKQSTSLDAILHSSGRNRTEVLESLMQSHHSIQLNLKKLRRIVREDET